MTISMSSADFLHDRCPQREHAVDHDESDDQVLTDDERCRLEVLLSFLEPDADPVRAHDHYHDEAVLEFPQSGERFEGVVNFRTWREQYPADVEFRLRRITGSGELWVRELSVSYDGGPSMLGIAVVEFDGPKVRRERIYVTEPWEAPEWRAQWRATRPSDP